MIHLRDGGVDAVELSDDERAISAEAEYPHIWVIVVKESPRQQEGWTSNKL
jgi:hypothetical protein